MKDSENILIIEEKQIITLDDYEIEIGEYLGILSPDTHYFKVEIINNEEENKLGLLRIGSVYSSLNYELKFRENFPNYGLFSKLLLSKKEESIKINPPHIQENTEIDQEITAKDTLEVVMLEPDEEHYEYLEEEYYPEEELNLEQIILLTYLPEPKNTLEHWLKQTHSLEETVSLIIQVCQCFSYIYQHKWCFIELLPQFIEVTNPIQFYDLTAAYPLDEILNTGILGNYSAPELTVGNKIEQTMSTYTIGALLYQCLHQKLPEDPDLFDLKIKPIPQFYQILKIALSPIIEERFYLSQLLSVLIDIRQESKKTIIDWKFSNKSTVGLSLNRLHNEDSYGVRYEKNGNYETIVFGIIADGMGGLAEGEVASKIAVDTVMYEPIPNNLKTIDKKQKWLSSLVEKANETINNQVKDGGTTLSIAWCVSDQLLIAHVGDSRIYLIRNGAICQLSEDHSLVQMLLSGGDITYEQSLEHTQKNVLLKSLGSKPKLSKGYVQDLSFYYKNLNLKLEDKDIIILCSDGVWDLVSAEEICEFFNNHSMHNNLDLATENIIEKVLEKGAKDNATIVALQCNIINIS